MILISRLNDSSRREETMSMAWEQLLKALMSAKITQITPNIGIPVIFFSISPDFCMIAIVIE